jgi:hypothetical protein
VTSRLKRSIVSLLILYGIAAAAAVLVGLQCAPVAR